MKQEETNIELKSEEVQEILGVIPNWITRWGITVIFIALAGLLVVAGIVKYPEMISAEVTLTSNIPPVPVVAKFSGNLESLFVQEGDSVEKGDVIAIVQNTTNESDLEKIEGILESFLNRPTNLSLQFPETPDLGSLQSFYSDFVSNYKEYKLYASQGTNSASVGYIRDQIAQIEQMGFALNEQLADCNLELSTYYNNYLVDKNLYNQGVVSIRELQQTETLYFQKKADCENIVIQLNANDIRVQELNLEIFGLSSGDKELELKKYTELKESANKLKSEILLWKEQFIMTAPCGGQVSMNQLWSSSQYVNKDDEILSITQNNGQIKSRALLSNQNIGKVMPEQEVNIRFQSYNYMQYGQVQGEITNVSAVPRDGFYIVEISLVNGLTTTYGTQLRFQQGMVGTAQIITEKRSVLSRIFDKFKFIFA